MNYATNIIAKRFVIEPLTPEIAAFSAQFPGDLFW